MADGFSELSVKKLATDEGVAELNRMLQFLFNNVPGDGLNQRIFSGYATPEGAVVADIGSIYLRKDGGATTSIYVKEAGIGTATNWVAK